MKQFLYIATLFVALFLSYMDGNVAYGQNMAREYNPNSPWNQADTSDKYYMERCQYCDTWITGTSETFKNQAMQEHIRLFHPEVNGNNTDTPDTNNGSSEGQNGGSSNNQYSNEASLVHIRDVANAMQIIGKCNYYDFMIEYQCNVILWNDDSAKASSIVSYITSRYDTIPNMDLRTAINHGYSFIVFTRPSSGKYYNVYTNYCINSINSLVCDYFIVFR